VVPGPVTRWRYPRQGHTGKRYFGVELVIEAAEFPSLTQIENDDRSLILRR
jgi:hypothetical protein